MVIMNESETEDLVMPVGTTLGWVECVAQVTTTDALGDLEEGDEEQLVAMVTGETEEEKSWMEGIEHEWWSISPMDLVVVVAIAAATGCTLAW